MHRLQVDHILFEELSNNPPQWWNNLKSDKDLCIQIRKDNSIDVYFNGGALITGLKYDGRQFNGAIHKKYIPVKGGTYVKYLFNNGIAELSPVETIKIDNFSPTTIKAIKERICLFYSDDSEKGIQYKFIKNDPSFIDSEFEYKDKAKTIRIDLVRADTKIKQIVFVEVKTIGANCLKNNEIVKQMKGYKEFIESKEQELLLYYKKVVAIKRRLGILSDFLKNKKIEEYTIMTKPLLLFGDCGQNWINEYSLSIDKKIKDYAVGSYYFGTPKFQCDIVIKQKANRHIF